MDLVLRYYPDADILVVELGGGSTVDKERLDNNVVVGYDEGGRAVRAEVRNALRRGLLNIVEELVKARRDMVEHILKATP